MTEEMSFSCDICGRVAFGHYPHEWRMIRTYPPEPSNGEDKPEFRGDICDKCYEDLKTMSADKDGRKWPDRLISSRCIYVHKNPDPSNNEDLR